MSSALVLLLALLQFCLLLNRRDITTAHEGRVAATAREMLASGDWLIPHVNGQLRLQKPPLPYWAAAALWRAAGSVDAWLARLPAALCGAVATLLVMDLARLTLGRGAPLVAGLLWLGTWFVVAEYRKAMADPYLAFFTLLSVWAWIRADAMLRGGTAMRSRSRTPSGAAGASVVADPSAPSGRVSDADTSRTSGTAGASRPSDLRGTPGQPPRISPRLHPALCSLPSLLILLAYLSGSLGTLAKGPIVLLHVALALLPYHLIHRTLPRRPLTHAIGAVIFVALSTAWPIYVATQVPGAVALWRGELAADRAAGGGKAGPLYHYLANLPVVTAPWTAFAVVGLLVVLLGRSRRDRRALWPLAWLAATVLAFTLVPMKKNAYLLPAMPAATLLAAAPLAAILRKRTPDTTDRLLFAGHALAAAVAVTVVLFMLTPAWSAAAAAAAAALAVVGATAWRLRRGTLVSTRTFVLTAAGFAVALHVAVAWLDARTDNRRSDRPFAAAVSGAAGGAPALYFIGPGPREDVLFYLGRTVTRVDRLADVPPDFRGHAIVTAGAEPDVRRRSRATFVTESAPRPRAPDDKLYLFRIEPAGR